MVRSPGAARRDHRRPHGGGLYFRDPRHRAPVPPCPCRHRTCGSGTRRNLGRSTVRCRSTRDGRVTSASGPKPRPASGKRGGARRCIRGGSRVEHRDGVRLPPRDARPGHALVSHALRGSICPRRLHHGASLRRLATPHGLLSCVIGAVPLIRHSADGQRRLVTPHQYPVARSCTAGVVVHWAPLWGGAGHADGYCHLVRHPGPGGDAAGRCLRRRCRSRAAALVRCPSHQFEEPERSIRADSLGRFGGGCRPGSGYEVHIDRTGRSTYRCCLVRCPPPESAPRDLASGLWRCSSPAASGTDGTSSP